MKRAPMRFGRHGLSLVPHDLRAAIEPWRPRSRNRATRTGVAVRPAAHRRAQHFRRMAMRLWARIELELSPAFRPRSDAPQR